MQNEKLIAFLLKMASNLIGIRPERRAAAMYFVANQLNEMAAELLMQCDFQGVLIVAPEPGKLNAHDIELVVRAGYIHGHLPGEGRLMPSLQNELHPCVDCGKTLWTCPLVQKPGESPMKPLCAS
jgi:hypothetical protein